MTKNNDSGKSTTLVAIDIAVFSALLLDVFFFALIVLSALITMSSIYLLFNPPNLSNLC